MAEMERSDHQLTRIGLLAAISDRAAELGQELFDEAEDEIAALTERVAALEEERNAALRMADRMRDDYAWLLTMAKHYGSRWDEPITVDDEPTQHGASIMEMANNRFHYQSAEHRAAFDMMRALAGDGAGRGEATHAQ